MVEVTKEMVGKDLNKDELQIDQSLQINDIGQLSNPPELFADTADVEEVDTSISNTPVTTPFDDSDFIGHGVLEEAQNLTIDGIIANRKLEEATGIPAEIHAEDGDEGIALAIRKAVLKENAQKAATTTEWMRRSAENAALGQKDYSSLSLAEEAINTVGALFGGAGQGFGSLLHGASKINRDVSKDMVNVLASGFSMIDENLGSAFKKAMNAKWIPWYLTPEGNVRELGKSLKFVGEELTPDNPSLFQEAVGAVGQIGAQWTVYLATGGVFGLLALYSQGYDVMDEKIKAANKEDAEWAGLAKTLGGTVTLVTEKYGLDNLFKRIPSSVRNRMVRMMLSFGSEFSQEVLENIGQNLVITGLIDPKAPVFEKSALHEGTVAGLAAGMIQAALPGKVRSAKSKRIMDKASKAYENTELQAKAPEIAGVLREEILEKANIEEVSVDAAALVKHQASMEDGDQFIQDIGVDPAALLAASQAGETVAIPRSGFAAHIFGTDNYQALSGDLSYKLGEKSAKAAVADIADNAEAAIEAVTNDKKIPDTMRTRTLNFLENFLEGDVNEMQEVLANATPEMVDVVEGFIAQVKNTDAETEALINKGRRDAIETELSQIENEISHLSDTVEQREKEGKPNVRNEKRFEKLINQQDVLQAELESLSETEVSEKPSAVEQEVVIAEEEIEGEVERRTLEDRIPALAERVLEGLTVKIVDGKSVRYNTNDVIAAVKADPNVPDDIKNRLDSLPDLINDIAVSGSVSVGRFEALRLAVKNLISTKPDASPDLKKLSYRLDLLDIPAIRKQERADVDFVIDRSKKMTDAELKEEIEQIDQLIKDDPMDDESFNRVQEFASALFKAELLSRHPAPAAPVKGKAEIKAERLRAMNVRSTRQHVTDVRKAFRAASKAVKDDVKAAQQMLTTIVKESGLSRENQAMFINTIKSMDSTEKLAKKLPVIQAKIISNLDRQRKAQLKGAIAKTIKKAKADRASGKPKGKTTPEINDMLIKLEQIMKLDKKGATEQLARLENNMDEITSPTHAIENMLLMLKADSSLVDANDLEKLATDLDDVVVQGKAITKANRLYKALEVGILRDEVERAIGDAPVKVLRGKKEGRSNVINTFFLSWNGAWHNKLQFIFTSKDKAFVDDLMKRLSLFEESRAHETNKTKSVKRFTELMQRRVKMTERQMLKQWHRDLDDTINLGKFTLADGTTVREIEMNRAEARKRLMELQNPDVRAMMMDKDGPDKWTPAMEEALRAEMNEFDNAMMASQMEFYAEYYERINKVYRRLYGVNLPKVEAYVPIRRDFGNEEGQNPDEFLKSILYRGGIVPGGLKTRQPNSQRLAVQSDVAAMQGHITEMEYFIAYAEKVSTLNQVFSGESNKVMNLIKDKYGRVAVDTIKADLGWFANRGVIMSHAGEQFFTRLMRNYGFAQLGAKPQIGLKQLASFSAMAADVKTKDFVAGLVKLSVNPAKAWRTMNKSTFFSERGMNIDNDFRELRADAFSGKLLNFMGRNPSFTKVMMTAIRFGDKGAIFLGGYAHVHAKMKEGFTEEQALDSMARLANKTQQSSDPDQTTALQRSTAPAILRILGQFMSSANAVTRAELEAIHEFRKGRLGTGEFAKRILIHHLIIPNLIMFLTNGLAWDDEDQLFASILGSFNGLLILGDVIEYGVASAMDRDKPFEPDGRHPLELANGLIEAITGDWDDVSFEDIIEGSKTIERLLKFGGDLTGIPSNTLFNMLRGTVLFAEDEFEEGAGLMMGYSPYILEKNK